MIVPFRTSVNGPRLLAETVGTFVLVVIGPGAAAVNLHTNGAMSHVGVALSFAFVILAGIYASGTLARTSIRLLRLASG